MNQKDLDEMLRLHKLWRNKKKGGVRANLSSERLEGLDLKRANLSGAILTGANMTGASLHFADLSFADLTEVNLSFAILFHADLSRANLKGANLDHASLSFANLKGANLSCANLSAADLRCANLENAILPEFQLPQSGDLTGFKKINGGKVLELLIPDGSRRTASLIGNKCRCERAFVVRALDSDENGFGSMHDPTFMYKVGKFVAVDDYDDDIRYECRPGIHFFRTKEEAQNFWA